MSDDRKSEDYLEVVMKLKADPPLHRFRTYWGLVRGMRSALKTIDLELEASKERLRALEEDAAFVKRHRAKLDICYRALRGTYAAPDRAMAAFNLLCRNISAEAAVQEIGLGSHRLGTALGRTFFGIRSQARKDAEANYASNVVTALSSIIKDQGAYLEMLAKNVESRRQRRNTTSRRRVRNCKALRPRKSATSAKCAWPRAPSARIRPGSSARKKKTTGKALRATARSHKLRDRASGHSWNYR